MDDALIRHITHRAAMIATKMALDGTPVETIEWIPPRSASSDWGGTFAVITCHNLSASETPPWER